MHRRTFLSGTAAISACCLCSSRAKAQGSGQPNLRFCTEVVMSDVALASDFAKDENPKNRTVNPNSTNAEAISITQKKWNPRRLHLNVDFVDDVPFKDKIIGFARQWEDYMGLKFKFGRGEPNILVSIRPGGSWSYVGTDCTYFSRKGLPSMNFGWFNDTTSDEEFRRTTLHEFGHALSLVHEHQHPHASISWRPQAVYDYYRTTYEWDKDTVDRFVLRKQALSQINGSEYDKASIMNYPIPPELLENPSDAVGWNNFLSNSDKEVVAYLFPKVGSRPPAPSIR